MLLDLSSAFRGFSITSPDLLNQIGDLGWSVKKIHFDKQRGVYVAVAKNPYGEEVEKTGNTDHMAVRNLLIAVTRKNHIRTTAQWKIGMWRTNFVDQLQPIAEAYAKAPVYDPKAAAAFKELADDSVRRSQVLGRQLKIEVTDDPEPYPNAQAMAEDIHKRRHFVVSRAHSEHPLWTPEQNVAFRIVHDVLGHAVSGGDFGWQGENQACAAHFPLLSPTAQGALFSECIAQTAYAAYYRAFGPQKVALFPQFYEGAQQQENEPGFAGVHPSQSVAPTAMPTAQPSEPVGLPQGTIAPHQEALGLTPLMGPGTDLPYANQTFGRLANIDWWHPRFQDNIMPIVEERATDPQAARAMMMALRNADELAAKGMPGALQVLLAETQFLGFDAQEKVEQMWLAVHPEYNFGSPEYNKRLDFEDEAKGFLSKLAAFGDPNATWTSGISPKQPNAYLDHGDPLQGQEIMNNAKQIDTEWHLLKDGDGRPDYERMRQAIVNAFRAVLLSPRKDLRWNAIHYQDISHVPAGTTDPAAYWNALENRRQEWNVARFGEGARYAHMPYAKFLPQFQNIIYQMNPHAGWPAAQARAKQLMFDWQTEEQNRIMAEDQEKPQDKQRSTDEVERRANEALARRMQMYIKEFQPKLDFMASVADGENQPTLFEPPEAEEQELPPDKYGAFMGTHLKAIAQISQHADNLLKAALEDVHEHDGAGHHFRATVLQLGIPGAGPKVASFAWLLLQPMTSQLATIDTHMMDVLGHNYEKEMNNRDYFKYERELAAGRDAAGYSHIPLGTFQWGMWDFKRTGPGSHQDHSALRVLDPKPHDSIDWVAKARNLKGDTWLNQAPDWWQNTQDARDYVGALWDQQVAPNFRRNQIPYSTIDDDYTGDDANDTQIPTQRAQEPIGARAGISARTQARSGSGKTSASEEFSHWWNTRKPISGSEAEILGEYAAGIRLGRKALEQFLSKHEDDVRGDFKQFKRELLETYDRFKQSRTAAAVSIPWFKHPQTGEQAQGQPGQTLMQHATTTLGLSTPEVWRTLGENAGKVQPTPA